MDAAGTSGVVDVKDNDDNIWMYQLDKSFEDSDAWIKRLKKRVVETKWQDYRSTIYRVPCGLRKIDPIAYEPRTLSLGPYHHGKPHLKAMDELKWYYLKRFLSRNLERALEDYLKLVAMMEARTREAYSEVPQIDSKDWVEMMLLDSCFAVEFLLMLWENKPKESSKKWLLPDPIESNAWVVPHVLADMLLLENQLPFFLLEELFELISLPSKNSHSLDEIILAAFLDLMPGKTRIKFVHINIHHILHLLYDCTLPSYHSRLGYRSEGLKRTVWNCSIDILLWKFVRSKRSNSIFSHEPIPLKWMPSAKNLKDAGVVFRKKTKDVTSFMDITFRGGTLEIPPLQIFGHSISLFRNLIAFEQCYTGLSSPTYLTAYADLMDCIINTPADIDLLQQAGIIVSKLGNDEDVAQFFNRLRTDAAIDVKCEYLSSVYLDVQHHCDKRVNKWKASLNHKYFGNPWAIVSVIAAVFLFMLTIMQTVFTVLSSFQHGSH